MPKPLKLLLTGGSGYIGRFLTEQLGENYVISTLDRSSGCDVTDAPSVTARFEQVRPEIVVDCITYGNAAQCEANQTTAHRVNVEAKRHLLKQAREYRAFFVYLSTDYVFDGKKGYYTEEDLPRPVNYFGETKLEFENVVKENYPERSLIIRTGRVYGYRGAKKSNVDLWALAQLEKGETIEAYEDVFSTPTFVGDIARGLMFSLHLKVAGLYHLTGCERVNVYEYLQALARKNGFRIDRVRPIPYPSATSVVRPKDVSLVSTTLEKKLGIRFLSLSEGLDQSSY